MEHMEIHEHDTALRGKRINSRRRRLKKCAKDFRYCRFSILPRKVTSRVDYGLAKMDPRLFTRACVVEEITRLMGLPNDSRVAAKSIFNDEGRRIELTEADQWLLRLLCDPAIKIGPPRAEANKIAAHVLRRPRPGG